MADPYLASNEFPGDGSTTLYNISFKGNRPDAGSGVVPYLNPADVKAQVITPATASTAEVVVDVPCVYVGPNQFRVTPATPVGKIVRIYRSTQDEYALVDYQALQTVGEADLDLSNRQVVFIVQESHDLAQRASVDATDASQIAATAVVIANSAVTTAEVATSQAAAANAAAGSAVVTANAATTTANGAVTTANSAVTTANAANATANTALTQANSVVAIAEGAQTTADNAVNIANAATATAEGIDGKAQDALDTAQTAVNIATDATNTANGIDAKAQSALDASAAATNTANTANTTAGNAQTQATNAVNTANTAQSTANGVDAKATTALSNANTALTNANAAQTTANAAVKTFNGRAPVGAQNIVPAAGDYTVAQITGAQDASNLTSGTLSAGRLSGSYNINVTSANQWSNARTLSIGGGWNGSVGVNGASDFSVNLTEVWAWSTFAYVNGWSSRQSGYFGKQANGNRVQLNGQVVHAYPVVGLQSIATLPTGYRPAYTKVFTVPCYATGGFYLGLATMQIASDGVMTFVGPVPGDMSGGSGTYYIDLSGVSYRIDI